MLPSEICRPVVVWKTRYEQEQYKAWIKIKIKLKKQSQVWFYGTVHDENSIERIGPEHKRVFQRHSVGGRLDLVWWWRSVGPVNMEHPSRQRFRSGSYGRNGHVQNQNWIASGTLEPFFFFFYQVFGFWNGHIFSTRWWACCLCFFCVRIRT